MIPIQHNSLGKYFRWNINFLRALKAKVFIPLIVLCINSGLIFGASSPVSPAPDSTPVKSAVPYFDTLELTPSDDAYLQGSTRYDNSLLRLEQGNRTVYMKFDAGSVGGTITQVQLQLTISSDSGNGTVTAYEGSHSNWTEANLSTANAPSTSTSLATSSSSGSGTHTYDLSVSDLSIYSGEFTIILEHTGTNDLAYAAMNHTTTTIRPKLVITYTPADTQAPTAPTLSSTGQSDTTVDLSWTEATDDTAVTDYKIFKDGVLEATLGNVSSHQVTGLTAQTAYSFTVTALDAAANESVASNASAVTTDASPDAQAPTAPTLSSTGQSDTTVDLSWTGATDDTAVTGHKIFKDGVLETTLGNVSTHQVIGLTALTAYSFTVTAIDAAANESVASNAVNVTTDTSQGGGTNDWTLSGTDMYFTGGNIGIGTTAPGAYKLAVNGNIHAKEVKVDLVGWADYVFQKDYSLPTLEEVKKHIEEKGHLMNIPSAKEVEANGIALGEMNKLLLEKIEELTLYIIDQNKRITKLQEETGLKIGTNQ